MDGKVIALIRYYDDYYDECPLDVLFSGGKYIVDGYCYYVYDEEEYMDYILNQLRCSRGVDKQNLIDLIDIDGTMIGDGLNKYGDYYVLAV